MGTEFPVHLSPQEEKRREKKAANRIKPWHERVYGGSRVDEWIVLAVLFVGGIAAFAALMP